MQNEFSQGQKMKILLVDDHALFRDGMRYVLRKLDEQVDILDVGNFPDALNAAKDNPDLDLVLLDLHLPGSEGAPSVKLFHTSYPEVPVVVISGSDQREDIENVLNSGAMGFISKMSSGQDMIHALRLVLDGGIYLPPQLLTHTLGQLREDKRSWRTNEHGLTARQMEVLKQLALGLSNKDIGEAIGLAEGTVKIHVAAIFQALHVNKRMDAVQAAKRMGLLAENISNS
jgi:DNA-binding NarL/FixJ family response regulator